MELDEVNEKLDYCRHTITADEGLIRALIVAVWPGVVFPNDCFTEAEQSGRCQLWALHAVKEKVPAALLEAFPVVYLYPVSTANEASGHCVKHRWNIKRQGISAKDRFRESL